MLTIKILTSVAVPISCWYGSRSRFLLYGSGFGYVSTTICWLPTRKWTFFALNFLYIYKKLWHGHRSGSVTFYTDPGKWCASGLTRISNTVFEHNFPDSNVVSNSYCFVSENLPWYADLLCQLRYCKQCCVSVFTFCGSRFELAWWIYESMRIRINSSVCDFLPEGHEKFLNIVDNSFSFFTGIVN